MQAASPLQRQLADVVDELATVITTRPRRRSPVEAPLANTYAYVNLLAACTLASLRDHERARAYRDRAHQALAGVAADPVHAFLLDAFNERLEQAFRDEPWDAPLPPQFAIRYPELAMQARYKVGRAREALRILESEPVHAIPMNSPEAIPFSGRARLLPELDEIDDPDLRATMLTALVDSAELAPEIARRVVELAGTLPEADAIPILLRATARVADSSLRARALGIAARLGWGELVLQLVTPVDDPSALSTTIRALRQLGMTRELATLLDQVNVEGVAEQLVWAGGKVVVGDPRGAELLAKHRAQLDEAMTMTERLPRTRAVLLGYAHATVDCGLAGIDSIAQHMTGMTDSFGTNSHYCLAVLHVAESLFHGVAGLDFDRQGWL